MENTPVTLADLRIFKIELLNELKLFIQSAEPKSEVEWLRSAEVKKILQISAASLQSLRVCGKLCPVKIGGLWYYNRNEVAGLFTNK